MKATKHNPVFLKLRYRIPLISTQQKKHRWFIKRQLQIKIKIESTVYSDEQNMVSYTFGFRVVEANG